MKNLICSGIDSRKLIPKEQLMNLKGGVRDSPCGGGSDTYYCTFYPQGLSGPMVENGIVCTQDWWPPEPAIESVYPDAYIVACLGPE